MPTAAKLFAAVAFAAIGWLAAHVYIPGLPQGTQVGYFREITALIGLIVGWRVMGTLIGQGYMQAMGSGIRTSVTMTFWAIVVFSTYTMVITSTKGFYDGPMEAVTGTFGIMLDYGVLLARQNVIIVLVLGGIIGGYLAEFAARRWS
jgi:hypothetical protein